MIGCASRGGDSERAPGTDSSGGASEDTVADTTDETTDDTAPGDTGSAGDTSLTTDEGVTVGPLALSDRPRNVLVITLDTTRRDAIGRYSGDAEATPFLDRLLSEGIALDAHRACSDWTWESLLCAQAGRMPYRLGFAWSGETGGSAVIPDDVPLVSQALLEAGFQTALVSAQPFMGGGVGLSRGFQQVRYTPDQPAARLVQQTLLTLEALDADAPWYLNLHFLDPHHLYEPPASYLGALDALAPCPYDLSTGAGYEAMQRGWGSLSESSRALVRSHLLARYAAELRYLDDQLAALWAGLEATGALEETLVLVWTDHGEQLYQHGSPNHGAGLYDEETRGAALFWSSDLLAPAAWTEPTTHLDLWPTLLAALGVTVEMTMDGYPLGERPDDAPVFAVHYRGGETDQSVVVGEEKLLVRWDGVAQRYALGVDPGELEDRFSGGEEDAALWELLRPEVEAAAAAAGGAAAVLPDFE